MESCDQAEMQTKAVHYFLKYWGILRPGQNANKSGLKWWVSNNNNNNNEYLERLTRTGPKCLRLVKSNKIFTSCQPHGVALGWSNPPPRRVNTYFKTLFIEVNIFSTSQVYKINTDTNMITKDPYTITKQNFLKRKSLEYCPCSQNAHTNVTTLGMEGKRGWAAHLGVFRLRERVNFKDIYICI